MIEHSKVIRARRMQSNAAIAARDADGTVAMMMDDVTVAVAGGPVLTGRAASRAAFTEQFRDPGFGGYVRQPDRIVLASPAMSANESGRWTGTWGAGLLRRQMGGTYVAEWTHTTLGWFIQSEVFVSSS